MPFAEHERHNLQSAPQPAYKGVNSQITSSPLGALKTTSIVKLKHTHTRAPLHSPIHNVLRRPLSILLPLKRRSWCMPVGMTVAVPAAMPVELEGLLQPHPLLLGQLIKLGVCYRLLLLSHFILAPFVVRAYIVRRATRDNLPHDAEDCRSKRGGSAFLLASLRPITKGRNEPNSLIPNHPTKINCNAVNSAQKVQCSNLELK